MKTSYSSYSPYVLFMEAYLDGFRHRMVFTQSVFNLDDVSSFVCYYEHFLTGAVYTLVEA